MKKNNKKCPHTYKLLSKQAKIKNHLSGGRSLSGLEAWKLFGVYRLSSVIHRLRNAGMNIKTDMIRIDDNLTFARYRANK